ncbi:MAG: DUF3817 domain-containing protein [Verrucomicrobiales bacterium]|nr:DUF3817 domain-containing protein [Verrucomicrobiales bacterium]
MGLDLKHSLIDRLRLASLLDGISYIILLGIAMPLKYLADMPLAVRIVGSAHGFLWVALCLFLLLALVKKKLSFGWCVIVFVGALIPFMPFWLDHKLKAKKESEVDQNAIEAPTPTNEKS